MSYNLRIVAVACLIVLSTVTIARAQDKASFLRKGDVWVCVGDSITYNDTYRRTLQRVANHFHPDADIRIVNGGIWGAAVSGTKEQFEKTIEAQAARPTVVSVMIGMVDMYSLSKNGWHRGMPIQPLLEKYRQNLLTITRAIKEKGLTPVLLTPTLTDESSGWGHYWELTGSRQVLKGYGAVVREVAQAEGAFCIPTSEEMETAQDAMLNEQVFRMDGVHPSSVGQYEIAASILRHCGVAGPLAADGPRRLRETPASELPIQVSLGTRFLADGAAEIPFTITTDKPLTAKLTWSYRKLHGEETLTLTGRNQWSLKLPKGALDRESFQADDVVIDLADQSRRSLYIVDLFKTRVFHFKDGVIAGTVPSKTDRPEGKAVANWQLTRKGNALLCETEVFDSEIHPKDTMWPFGREGVTWWFDYRIGDRFADVGADADVHQVLLHVYDRPIFSIAFWPWLGRGMEGVASCTGEKTATGYITRLLLHDRFFTLGDSDLSQRDFVGFDLNIVDADSGVGGQPITARHHLLGERYHDTYANDLAIIDLKDRFPGDTITNVCLTKL